MAAGAGAVSHGNKAASTFLGALAVGADAGGADVVAPPVVMSYDTSTDPQPRTALAANSALVPCVSRTRLLLSFLIPSSDTVAVPRKSSRSESGTLLYALMVKIVGMGTLSNANVASLKSGAQVLCMHWVDCDCLPMVRVKKGFEV